MIWFIAYLGFIGVVLVAGYLGVVKVMGHEAINRNIRYSLPWVLVGYAIAFTIPFLTQWTPSGYNIFYLGYTVGCAAFLLNWPFRKRAAGDLLLSAGRTWHNKVLFWIGILEAMVAAFMTWLAFETIVSLPETTSVFSHIPKVAFWWTLAIFFLSLGLNKLELRENGLCFMYLYLPWQRMTSYAWELSQPNTLTIQRRPHFPLWPTFMSIRVPQSYRDEVDRIVQNYLPNSHHENVNAIS